ncbi:conserved hypothetical protein [Flavobacterium sp. 9AF]|uniref:hypothetical protein n=1 Tax=Flavobacterium sp. 9AF TaxID=2653142 RepID=UPI0012F0B301|nr:hypothetical protein [Flavobacterium sp. 9AF]VXA96356.1 conserved hypothetical protein [Flavobacterium sp. 9AF]
MFYFYAAIYSFVYSFIIAKEKSEVQVKENNEISIERNIVENDIDNNSTKVIHILVALCDNKYQGIVPVPKNIGNGQDPKNNLYWGCGYGVKTFFKKSLNWKLLQTKVIDSVKMERLVFRHVSQNAYLIADAYNGKFIKQCTLDFLKSCSGQLKESITVDDKSIGINGNSNLIGYIGHDGLMDFSLNEEIKNIDKNKRDCIILACYSKSFFSPFIDKANANPLVWTTGLMAPEAYTIHDAISKYCNGENENAIVSAAAKAYSKYQKCSEKSARKLLVSGW